MTIASATRFSKLGVRLACSHKLMVDGETPMAEARASKVHLLPILQSWIRKPNSRRMRVAALLTSRWGERGRTATTSSPATDAARTGAGGLEGRIECTAGESEFGIIQATSSLAATMTATAIARICTIWGNSLKVWES